MDNKIKIYLLNSLAQLISITEALCVSKTNKKIKAKLFKHSKTIYELIEQGCFTDTQTIALIDLFNDMSEIIDKKAGQ